MSFIWYPNDEDVASSTVAGGGAPITVMAVKELEGEDGEAMIKRSSILYLRKEILSRTVSSLMLFMGREL